MRGAELTWPGGEHMFALPIGQLRALQDKCDAGPAYILSRLASGNWLVDDVFETIRLGLEGGGMSKEDAREIVKRRLESEPYAVGVTTAQAVLMAALYGVEDDPVGELEAGAETPVTSSREGALDGHSSTDGATT